MKAGITGGGAMGALFAHYMDRAGVEWALYDNSTETVDAFRQGVTVRVDETDIILEGPVSTGADVLRGCGVVFMFVKSFATAGAISAIAPFLDPGSVVVSLQNGLGNAETISRITGAGRLVYGSTMVGAAKTGPRTVVYGGGGGVTIGGSDPAAVERVRELLARAGLSVTVSPRPNDAVWRKAVINAAINPLGALLGVPNGALATNPHAREIQGLIVAEATAVARARGMDLEAAGLAREVAAVCASTAKNLCSMLQDVRAGRRTEIDAINGAIARYGEESGIPVPYNRLMAMLINAKESMAVP